MRNVSPVTRTLVELRSTDSNRSSIAIRVGSHIFFVVATCEKTIAPAPTVSCW